jgi:hypothetical protein
VYRAAHRNAGAGTGRSWSPLLLAGVHETPLRSWLDLGRCGPLPTDYGCDDGAEDGAPDDDGAADDGADDDDGLGEAELLGADDGEPDGRGEPDGDGEADGDGDPAGTAGQVKPDSGVVPAGTQTWPPVLSEQYWPGSSEGTNTNPPAA